MHGIAKGGTLGHTHCTNKQDIRIPNREGVVVWRRLLPSLAQAPVDPFIEGKCGQCISYELKGGQGGVGRGVWCYQGWGVLWALWRV